MWPRSVASNAATCRVDRRTPTQQQLVDAHRHIHRKPNNRYGRSFSDWEK